VFGRSLTSPQVLKSEQFSQYFNGYLASRVFFAMQLTQEEIDHRRELWVGLAVGLVCYLGDALGSWWLLDTLHYGRQQFLAVPLLALGLLLLEAFAIRKFSDRIATAFDMIGLGSLPVALLIIGTWLRSVDLPG